MNLLANTGGSRSTSPFPELKQHCFNLFRLNRKLLTGLLMIIALVSFNQKASAQIRITEYMYSGTNGEFVEFTNVGNTAVDMTGWSFDDNSRTAGSQTLTDFGLVQPGESVILTETVAATFRTAWNLCNVVKVIGGLTQNLGRADEINLYDGAGVLVDRLTYDDQTLGGPRTQNASAWVNAAGLGTNTITNWTLSVNADTESSYSSSGNDKGSPGKSTRATVAFAGCNFVTLMMNRNFLYQHLQTMSSW